MLSIAAGQVREKTARRFRRTASLSYQTPLRLVLATLAASICGPLAVLREIAGVVRRTATPVVLLATLSAGFRCTFWIVDKIATALLPPNMAGARCLLAIFSEIAWVSCMTLFRHRATSFYSK